MMGSGLVQICQPSALPAAVVRAQLREREREMLQNPRAARRRLAREEERQRERMAFRDEIQRDYVRWAGIPLGFTAVASYGVGPSPLTFPSAATLRSWHMSNRGITLGAQLIPTLANPAVSFSGNINQSVPARLDILSNGNRGVATYGLTIDGGASYFQSGVTATTVNVPAFGQAMTMNLGTYQIDTYAFVVVSMENQTSLPATLEGAPGTTDANRPRLFPNVQNGYAAMRGAGGTNGALVDTVSSWGADVCSGVRKPFTWIMCVATDNATPASALPFMSFADNVNATPVYQLTVRNGTNVFRAWHVTDANVTTIPEGGALDLLFHVMVVQQDAAGLVTVRRDGAAIIGPVTWGAATQTTISNVALFGSNRGNVQAATNRSYFLEENTYTSALALGEVQQLEGYYKSKYSTP